MFSALRGKGTLTEKGIEGIKGKGAQIVTRKGLKGP